MIKLNVSKTIKYRIEIERTKIKRRYEENKAGWRMQVYRDDILVAEGDAIYPCGDVYVDWLNLDSSHLDLDEYELVANKIEHYLVSKYPKDVLDGDNQNGSYATVVAIRLGL